MKAERKDLEDIVQIKVPELDVSSMAALRKSFENMVIDLPNPPPFGSIWCCDFCTEFDKLDPAIQKKILLLMKLGGADIA